MGVFRSFGLGSMPSMPIAKVGFPLPMPVFRSIVGQTSSAAPLPTPVDSASGHHAPDQRHNFAVKALAKSGLFKPRPYIYICVRCRYTFMVNERRGSIVALDRNAKPVYEPENSRRLATFAQGPCPAFKSSKRQPEHNTLELVKPRRKLSPFGILGLVALIGSRMRYPYLEFNTYCPTVIVPQDLLF